jgi:hypothetical protein
MYPTTSTPRDACNQCLKLSNLWVIIPCRTAGKNSRATPTTFLFQISSSLLFGPGLSRAITILSLSPPCVSKQSPRQLQLLLMLPLRLPLALRGPTPLHLPPLTPPLTPPPTPLPLTIIISHHLQQLLLHWCQPDLSIIAAPTTALPAPPASAALTTATVARPPTTVPTASPNMAIAPRPPPTNAGSSREKTKISATAAVACCMALSPRQETGRTAW